MPAEVGAGDRFYAAKMRLLQIPGKRGHAQQTVPVSSQLDGSTEGCMRKLDIATSEFGPEFLVAPPTLQQMWRAVMTEGELDSSAG